MVSLELFGDDEYLAYDDYYEFGISLVDLSSGANMC